MSIANPPTSSNTFNRRDFLKTSLAVGGGLLVSFYLPKRVRGAEGGAPAPVPINHNAFVRINPDDTVTVLANHSEMGQGIYTGLAMVIAEELDADWSKVKVESAPVDAAYNHTAFGLQMTGGSSSQWSEMQRYRQVGATARALLIAAAASQWKVDASKCRTENGFVIGQTGEKLSYGQLATAAAAIKPPADIKLKDAKDFKIIGKPTKRLDAPAKTDGSAVFGIDVKIPGMLTAVIERPPVFGAKLKSFDAAKAKAMPGVKYVVAVDAGVAVVSDHFWNAKQAAAELVVVWDDGPLANLNSASQRDDYIKLGQKPGKAAKKQGDVDSAVSSAAQRLEAIYELPYLAHAPMEPLNCVADVRDDKCEIWTGTQFQTPDRAAAAKAAGLKPEQVTLHTTLLGGGFGRRAVPDSHFVVEAVQVSKAIKTPVKVIWTREDDIRGGYYRPRATHLLRAGLDASGNINAWQQRIVCQSFIMGTPFEAFIVKDGIDGVAVEGAADSPYDIPNQLVDWATAPGGVPTLWWRSVGHSHTAFVVESFIDELAHAAKKDPVLFRLEMLSKFPRHAGVLKMAADRAGWATPPAKGIGRGVAVHESFGSFVAQVAEVSVDENGWPKVHRVVCAVDCGPTVNPESIRAQLEGSVVFGLTAALYGEITFDKGRVQQRNFHDYKMLRINEMPVVEVHIVPSTEAMGGIGETGVPPVAPAFTNAIFAATGKRIRSLPIRPDDLKAS